MRERDRRLADRAMQFHRPLGDFGRQPARKLVGLVQVDVEQRNADAQRADDLDVVVLGAARRLRPAAVEDVASATGRPSTRRQREVQLARPGRGVSAAASRPAPALAARRGRGRSIERDVRRTTALRQRQRLRGMRIERVEQRLRRSRSAAPARRRCGIGAIERAQVELERTSGSGAAPAQLEIGADGQAERQRRLAVDRRDRRAGHARAGAEAELHRPSRTGGSPAAKRCAAADRRQRAASRRAAMSSTQRQVGRAPMR